MSSNVKHHRQDSSKILGATHCRYLLSVNDENFLLESVTHFKHFVPCIFSTYGMKTN